MDDSSAAIRKCTQNQNTSFHGQLEKNGPIPLIENILADTNPTPLPPVVIRLLDGKTNFREMKIAERDVMNKSFIAMIGTPRDSEIRRGGDLFVHPVDSKQQEALLNIKQIAGRPVSCSLPNSFRKFKGRIQGVPVEDTIEEIKKALENQDVVDVFRPKNPDGSPSEKIILTFASGLPGRVKISSISYDVRQYFPTTFRCRLCWRLGHTHSFCGQHHETGVVCQQRCVNCGKSDHESDSAACPSYVELRNALKIAVMENITVKEAKMRPQSLYSTIARSSTAPSPADNRSTIVLRNPTTRPPEITLLQAQVAQLQTEMNMMKEATIPSMSRKFVKLRRKWKRQKQILALVSTGWISLC